jgi:hypothetical protein
MHRPFDFFDHGQQCKVDMASGVVPMKCMNQGKGASMTYLVSLARLLALVGARYLVHSNTSGLKRPCCNLCDACGVRKVVYSAVTNALEIASDFDVASDPGPDCPPLLKHGHGPDLMCRYALFHSSKFHLYGRSWL